MTDINSYFQQIGFTGDVLKMIADAFVLRSFDKNEMVVTKGRISKSIGIVEEGMFQYYTIKDGVEITSYVSVAGTWVASVRSFISEKPAVENIRAITAGRIYLISRAQLKQLVRDVPAFKDFYINLLEQAICGIDESRYDLITLSAEQRYEKLLRNEPHLLQQVPLQHLASILGITPRHLSRIRNNIR